MSKERLASPLGPPATGGGLRGTLSLPWKMRGHGEGGRPWPFDPRVRRALRHAQQPEEAPRAGGTGHRAAIPGWALGRHKESGGNGAFFPFIFPSVLALGVHESSLGPSHAFGETLSPALRGNDDVCQDPRYYYGVITVPQESTQTVATCSRPRGLRHQLPPLQRKPRKEKSQACGVGAARARENPVTDTEL